jgi:protein MBA1
MQLASAENTVMGQSAPNVQTTETRGVQEMAEDIGLLQNTVIRARLSKLPSPLRREFYAYFWTLLKSRFTGLYTRSHFKRCVVKKGIKSYLPVDFLQQGMLKKRAKSFYRSYYESLAAYVSPPTPSLFRPNTQVRREIRSQSNANTMNSGDAKSLQHICLPPLAASLRSQIAARGPVKMSWHLHKFKSARIVSHRCAPLGADQPDTSYRQCIVRLESEQTLATKPVALRAESRVGKPVWAPASIASLGAAKKDVAKKDVEVEKAEQKQTQTVVEYLVMQTRVMGGKTEDWKIWGFAGETTPAKMEEDEAYWKKMLDIQASAA